MAEPSLSLDPPAPTLGDTAHVEIRAQWPGKNLRDLRLVAELGTLEISDDATLVRARWTLPDNLLPRRVAVALVDTRSGEAHVATLPVSRRARLKIWTEADADVALTLKGAPPIVGRSDKRGKLEVSVVVPPGADLTVIEQQLKRVAAGTPATQELGLRNAAHVFAVPSVNRLVPDGAAVGHIHWFVYRDDGEPTQAPLPTLTDLPYTRVSTRAVASGHFVTDVIVGPFPAELEAPPQEITLVAAFALAEGELKANARLSLDALGPASVALGEAQTTLGPGELWLVDAYVRDLGGRGVSNQKLEVETQASVTVVGVEEHTQGHYRVSMLLPRKLPDEPCCQAVARVGANGPRSAPQTLVLRSGKAAQLTLASRPHEGEGTLIALTARDGFANTVAPKDVRWQASSGAVQVLASADPSEALALWRPPSAARDAHAVVTVMGEEGLQASLEVRHARVPAALRFDLAAGALTDFGSVRAAAVHLRASWDPQWAPPLRVIVDADAAFARRGDTASVVGAQQDSADLTRWAVWVPALVGLEGDVAMGAKWLLRLSGGTGILWGRVVSLVEGVPSQGQNGISLVVGGSLEAVRAAGPGSVILGLRGIDALGSLDGFGVRPRALGLFFGYTIDL